MLSGARRDVTESACAEVVEGDMRERSSMKLPAARLVGVRGR